MSISDELNSRLNIVDIISEYVSLKKAGSEYKGLCPFHSEKTPSFSVSDRKQAYHCFGCGCGGGMIKFVMDYNNIDYLEAVGILAKKAGIDLTHKMDSNKYNMRIKELQIVKQIKEVNNLAARFYVGALYSPVGERAIAYLNGRGMDKKAIAKSGLGYSPNPYALYELLKDRYNDEILLKSGIFKLNNNGKLADVFKNRLIFPILNENREVIAFGGRTLDKDGFPKYINSQETAAFSKKKTLYGLYLSKRKKNRDYFLICEGYMDVIALNRAGYDNAVASLGTSLTTGQLHLIKAYTDNLYFMYDSDEAGIKAINRAIPLAIAEGLYLKVVDLKPYKDPDEFLSEMGKEELEKRIENAVNPVFFRGDVLYRNVDKKDPDSRLRFFNQLADILSDISDNIVRTEYISSCADRYLLDKNLLLSEVNSQGYKKEVRHLNEEQRQKDRDVHRKKPNTFSEAQGMLLACLIDDKNIYDFVNKYIEEEDFTVELFKKSYNSLRKSYDEFKGFTFDGLSVEEESELTYILLKGADFLTDNKENNFMALKELIIKVKMQRYDELKKSLENFSSEEELITKRNELAEIKKLIEKISSLKDF